MADLPTFKGRTVIVTGGTKGVGRGISQAFLEQGANVVVCGRNEPETLPEHDGNKAVFVAADVREADQVQAVIDAATETFGSLDILINNAGGAPFAMTADVSPRFMDKIIGLNLMGPLYFSQAANKVMQTQDTGGVIVNIGSISAVRPSPGTAIYGAAKAGLLNLTQSLAVEWAPKVRINVITAGMILTEQSHLHYGDEAGIKAVAKTVPLQRLATPKDIAEACLFLASEQSSYISGTSLTVHGGGERPAFLDAATANQG